MDEINRGDGSEKGEKLVPPTSPAPKKIPGTTTNKHSDFSSFRKRMENIRDNVTEENEVTKGNQDREVVLNTSVYSEIEDSLGESVSGRVRQIERRMRLENKIDGLSIPLRSGTLVTRFLGYCRADAQSGCWNWTGPFDKHEGKCTMTVFGHSMFARRIGYELFVGITTHWKNFHMDCDNMKCVNPAHMTRFRPVKAQDEKRDYNLKNRRSDSKLTADEVDEIRASLSPRNELAKKYGVTPWYIWAIKTGRKGMGHKPLVEPSMEDVISGKKLTDLQRIMGYASIMIDLEENTALERAMSLEAKLNGLITGGDE